MGRSTDKRAVVDQSLSGNTTKLEQAGRQDLHFPVNDSKDPTLEQETPHNAVTALYKQMQQMQERIDGLSGAKSGKTS